MLKLESVIENKMHKILWGFEKESDHIVPAIELDIVSINKKEISCNFIDFGVPSDHSVKMTKMKRQTLWSSQIIKKLWNMRVTVIPIADGATEKYWSNWRNRDYPDYSVCEKC